MRDVVDERLRVVDRFAIAKEDGATARGRRATGAPGRDGRKGGRAMSRHPMIILLILGLPVLGAPEPTAGMTVLHARRVGATVEHLMAAEDPSPPDTTTPNTTPAEPESAEATPEPASSESVEGDAARESSPLGIEVTEFVQREPDDGEPVSVGTKAFVSYDNDNLHVVFVCEDDPAQVRARVVPRDRISDDDRVVVFLDTFDDNQRAYVFEVNPLGIQRDGFITEGQDDDYSFDALWYSQGRLTPDGYVVKLQVPFSSLRFSDKSAQTWGIGLARYIERKSEKSYWPHITDGIEGFVNQLGSLQGLSRISSGRRFQLVPYSVVADAHFLDDELDQPAFRRATEQRFGLDAKAVLRDAVTVDVAVRPDFSQVEPDEPQVTVNQRFEVRTDEKRPFFIENAGFFQTPIELFFSRRIADPTGGARVTSKYGPWVFGALLMNDLAPGRVPATDPMFRERAYAGVLRLQREFQDQSTLGLFMSDRELAGDFNRVYGIDTRAKIGKNWVATAQVAQAETREPHDIDEPANPRVWGSGGYAKIRRDGRHLDYSAKYTQFSPDFAAQLGFVRRVGFREVESGVGYTFRPRKSVVKSWGPSVNGSFNWNWEESRLQDAEIGVSSKVELAADTQAEVGWTQGFELYKDQEFRLHELSIAAESKWLKWLATSLSYQRGTKVNHDPADTIPGVPGGIELLPFVGQSQDWELGLTVRPLPRIELKQSLQYSWLHWVQMATDWGSLARHVYTNWIVKTKIKAQLNRELSVRAIANYEALIPNAALSDEDLERQFVPDFLVTYLVNPWTAVHAGYTERFENVLLDQGEVVEEPRSSHFFKMPATSVDRQYFLKLSYLFRM